MTMPGLDTFTLIALTLLRGAWTAAQVAAGAALIAAGLGLLLALLVVFVLVVTRIFASGGLL